MAAMALATLLGTPLVATAASAAQPKAGAVNLLTYSGAGRTNKLENAARTEGKLFVYSSTGDGIVGLVSAFNIIYPYIKVTYISGPPSIMIGPIQSSVASGNYNWDVVMETTVYYLTFRQMGAITPFYSPDSAHFTRTENVPATGNLVWGLAQSQLESGFMYNKTLIPDPPTSVNDLLSSRFDGLMDMPNSAGGEQFIGAVINYFGNNTKGLAAAEAYLAKLGPEAKLSGLSGTALIGLVANGQLGADMDAQLSQALTYRAEGLTNVGYESLFSAANTNLTMVAAHAPDPGAAMLWADFCSGTTANAAMNALYVIPATKNLPVPSHALGGVFYPAKIKKLTAFKFNAYSSEWQNLLQQYFH